MKPYLLAAALLAATAAAPASAQIEPDVTVNPNASGSRLLLYPGGQYGRVTRDLLQPGEPDPNAPIFLHMPRKHRHHAAVAGAKATPKTTVAAVATKPAKQAPPPPQNNVPLSELPDESAAKLVMSVQPPPTKSKPAPPKQQVAVPKPPPPVKQQPAPVKVAAPKPAPPKQTPPPKQVAAAKPPPPKGLPPAPTSTDAFVVSGDQSGGGAATPPPAPAAAQPAPTRTASVEPPPPAATTELSKRSSIVFAPGAEEPPAGALDTIKGMISSLTAALWSGSAHIQLEAFGGKQGDKSSDARRLSLKRALIVRQLLIDDGIPSERIVVRAMGGAPGGALDRVDIFVAA